MSQKREELLAELTDQLRTLDQEIESGKKLTYKLSDLNSPDRIAEAKAILDQYGVLFVTGAIDSEQTKIIKRRIIDAHNTMFGPGMHNISVQAVKSIPAKAQAGILANKGFAYLYKHPVKQNAVAQMEVDGIDVNMSHNPIYSKVNLATLTDPQNRRLTSVLFALTHPLDGMVSWDSCKVATNFKRKANPFTRPHIDYYSDLTLRYQVILNVSEQRTKLFYTPNTINEKIKPLISKLQSDPNFFTNDGFKGIKPPNAEALRPFMLAPPPGSLTFWKSGIVHAEYTANPQLEESGLYRPDPRDATSQLLNQLVIRMVIGTQKPYHLTPDALKSLGVAALKDLIPHRNYHGSNQKVVLNKMHKGKTSYPKHREQPKAEWNLIMSAVAEAEDPETVEEFLKTVDPMTRHLLGISLERDQLWPELKALLN